MDLARVLVVDDDQLVARTVQRALMPHYVEIERDPIRAATRLAGGERFDLILCGFYLAAIDGGDVLGVVSKTAPEMLPAFVFLTTRGSTPADDAVIASAPGGVVQKPFASAELRRLADAAVARRVRAFGVGAAV